MPDDPSAPLPTPTNYQRTTGGNLHWQPPTAEHLQEMLPTYEILGILGQGGMGAVYKGRQRSLDRLVAIKILPPEAADNDMQFVERFKNEARTMAKMNHPAIVHVYDFGETTEGQLYIVMEFIDGTDVAKMIQSQGKLPEDYALSITAHVCDALGYAHTQGVVHRDIKPANVLINMDGQVKVADFGLAKATDPSQMGLTKTNFAMGTPDFVSPEALSPGMVVDGRADLYAVGVMLYNMLTGNIPRGAFRMPSATLQTDARFDKIILKAMEMDRENRYQTALDLRRDLDVILTTPVAEVGVQAVPAQQPALPQKPMGKSPGSPPQRKEGGAGTPARSVPADKNARTPQAADKSVRAPVAPAKKSSAGMIYGIAAAVAVIAGGAFMFFSTGKKPAPGPMAIAETKPETKPATPTATMPAASTPKPAPAPAAVAAGNEKWVDGLAQWFGSTKTDNDFVRQADGAVKAGPKGVTMEPLPASAPVFRDQAVRVRARLSTWTNNDDLQLSVRLSTRGKGRQKYLVTPHPSQLRLTPTPLAGNTYFHLPGGFDYKAVHTLELRVVGDLLTVSVDGKKIGEKRDAQITDGHPAITAKNVTIESFEYANLDPGAAAPAPAAVATGEMLTSGGHRYQLVLEKKKHWQATEAAKKMGGHLAIISSKEENEWIFKNVKLPPGNGDPIYIGGSLKDKSWKWEDGQPVDMSLWGGNGPNSGNQALAIRNGRWDDVNNGESYFFLIEWDDDGTGKPAGSLAASSGTAVPTPASDSAAPLLFGGHRYQLIREALTWDEAKAKAEAMGGHLATITSKEEKEWGVTNVRRPAKSPDSHFHIGGFRDPKDKAAAWKWVTGEPVDMSLWSGKGPDGSGHFLTAYFAGSPTPWDDADQKLKCFFLVEWDDEGNAAPIAAAPPLTQPVDLLALVDVKRDASKGEWALAPGGVVSKKGDTFPILEIQQTPPAEYDFEIEFTIVEGAREVSQALAVPGGTVFWQMGFGAAGEETFFCFGPYLDGKKPDGHPKASLKRARLKAGQRYRSLVEVRKDSLRALIDGVEVLKWTDDFKRFGNPADYCNFKNTTHLGLASYKSEVTFHKAELRSPGAISSSTVANVASTPSGVAQPPVAPAQALQSGAAASSAPNGRDLLRGVDVQRDSLYKVWRLEDGVLKSPLDAGSQETIMLTSTGVPTNYDMHYRITREERGYALRFVFLQGDGGGFVSFDGTDRGDANISGFSERVSVESGRGKWFGTGLSREVIIQVRESGVACLIDGQEIVRAQGRASKEGQKNNAFNPAEMQKPLFIGLSQSGGPLIVHEAKLVAIDSPMALAQLSALPPELTALDEQFLKLKAERVAAPFDVEVTKLNTGYIGGIARAIADEKKAGRLDGILALEAEKKLIEDKQPMPETDDAAVLPAIKTLRGIYRTAHAKLVTTRDANLKTLTEPLDKRLAQMETDFIKADRIADAKTARAYRDALAKSSPGLQPVKTAAIPEPAPAVNSAAAAVYKDGYANTLGMNFVAVKNTDVLMCIHETRCKDWAAYATENPRSGGTFKPRAVDGFTVSERAEDHPVTNTNWEQAHQFCEWLSKKEGKYYRLPTDREWSYAAGVGSNEKWRKDSLPSTITRDPVEFPWGKRWPPLKGSGNFSDESRKAKAPNKEARYLERYDDGFPTTAPVMSFDPNNLGIYDLSGNVWEWVEDYFNEKKGRALRGGGWETQDRGALLSSQRWERSAGNGYDYYGFRIVLVPGGRPPVAAAAAVPPLDKR